MDSESRSPCKLSDRMSIPSIVIEESLSPSISTSRKRVNNNDDFPDPVLPTMPSVVPAGTLAVTFFSTRDDDGLYRIDTFLNSMEPFQGHPDFISSLPGGVGSTGKWDAFSEYNIFSAFVPSYSFGIPEGFSL